MLRLRKITYNYELAEHEKILLNEHVKSIAVFQGFWVTFRLAKQNKPVHLVSKSTANKGHRAQLHHFANVRLRIKSMTKMQDSAT